MDTTACGSVRGFTLKEKLFAQISFNGGVIIGTYGLFQHDISLAVIYFLYAYIGIFLVVRYTVCPRCPHLHGAGDCLQLKASLTRRIISKNRKGPLNLYEKILFVMVIYGILIFPVYWIASDLIVLILFLLFYGGSLLGLWLYFCRECQNQTCIQNRCSSRC